MMELELKHLASYLPYKLNIIITSNQDRNLKGEMKFLENDYIGVNVGIKQTLKMQKCISHIKPILRPLSDLTKEIEVNGEKFVPNDLLDVDSCGVWINDANNQVMISQIDCHSIYAIDIYNNIIQKLLEWHFDIFWLIPNGLAIDINTLK